MRRCASCGLTGRGLVSGRSERPGYMSWAWPKEDQMNHARNPESSLAQLPTWPTDGSVRTLPCHRLPTPQSRQVSARPAILSYIRTGASLKLGCLPVTQKAAGSSPVVPAISIRLFMAPGENISRRREILGSLPTHRYDFLDRPASAPSLARSR